MCKSDLEPTAFIMFELHYLSTILERGAFFSTLSQKLSFPNTIATHNMECICHNTTCESHVGLSYESLIREEISPQRTTVNVK